MGLAGSVAMPGTGSQPAGIHRKETNPPTPRLNGAGEALVIGRAAGWRIVMTTTNDDTAILAMIAKCKDLWKITADMDSRALRLRKAGKNTEAAEACRRQDLAYRQACELEWQIVRTDAATAAGHEAKFRFACGLSADAEDFIEVAYRLGHEAGRLGLEPRAFEPQILIAAAAA